MSTWCRSVCLARLTLSHCLNLALSRCAAGLDSLGAVEYVNLVSRRLNVQLPSTLVFDFPTVSAITGHIEKKLAPRRAAEAAAAAAAAAAVAAGMDAGAAAVAARAAAASEAVPAPGIIVSPGLTPQAGSGGQAAVQISGLVFRALGAPGPTISTIGIGRFSLPVADSIIPVPLARWDRHAHPHHHSLAQPSKASQAATGSGDASLQTQFGAFLASVEAFDLTAFGLSPQEAAATDPQHRLLLECAGELLAPASLGGGGSGSGNRSGSSGGSSSSGGGGSGGALSAAQRAACAVCMGISWTEYHRLSEAHGLAAGPYAAQGAVLR